METAELTAAREMMEIVPLIMRTLRPNMNRPAGLPNQGHFHVLFALLEGPHNLSALAEKHNVTLPTMSNTITTLSEHGFVVRAQAQDDRRQVVIQLTEQGRQALRKSRDHTERRISTILEPLSDNDKNQLIAGLAILKKAFAGSGQS